MQANISQISRLIAETEGGWISNKKLETRLRKAKRLFLHGKNKESQMEIYYLLNESKYSAKIYKYRHIFSNVMVAHGEPM